MEQIYRISYHVKNAGFEIESTDKQWLEDKEKEYLDRVNIPLAFDMGEQSDEGSKEEQGFIQSNITIQEFYRKFVKPKIKTRPDITVFFVYFLEKIIKKDAIKTADVVQCFGAISYPNYNKINIADSLSKAKQRALLNFVNNQWSLTITGEDYVLNAISTNKE